MQEDFYSNKQNSLQNILNMYISTEICISIETFKKIRMTIAEKLSSHQTEC